MKAPTVFTPSNAYIFGFIALYVLNLVLANHFHWFETGDAIGILVVFGFGCSGIAWLLTRRAQPLTQIISPQPREALLLTALVLYIVVTLVFGNRIFFFLPDLTGAAKEVVTLTRKVLVFVLIPFVIYKILYRFQWADFGLSSRWRAVFSRQNTIVFLVMAGIMLLLNYGGKGAEPIRAGLFSTQSLVVGLPLLMVWLLIEVGLVEEFFFRGLLQNRLSVLLRSEWGAICTSALIFGLAHAPGMYYRGAGVVEGLGDAPSFATCVSYCMAMQTIPAFFFGILWHKTKNLWLLMGIHAALDLFPNFPDFAQAWGL